MHSASLRKRPITPRLKRDVRAREEASAPPSLPEDLELAGRSSPAKGIVIGLALGAGSWVAIFALIRSLGL